MSVNFYAFASKLSKLNNDFVFFLWEAVDKTHTRHYFYLNLL